MAPDQQEGELPAEGPDVPDALRRALASAAVAHYLTDDDDLRGALCEYVRDLKGQGLPPEAVVVAVKSAVHRSTRGLTPTYPERRDAAILLDRVVRWCIEEYFGGERDGQRPPS